MKTEIRKIISNMDFHTKITSFFSLAISISQQSAADIFVEYIPHINALSIHGYSLGWQKDGNADLFQNQDGYSATIYLDETSPCYKKSMETLDKILEQLEMIDILQNGITAAQKILGSETTSLLVADAAQGVKEYIKTYINSLQKM